MVVGTMEPVDSVDLVCSDGPGNGPRGWGELF